MYPNDEESQPPPNATLDSNARANDGQQNQRRGTFGQEIPIVPVAQQKPREPIKPPPDKAKRGTFGPISDQGKPKLKPIPNAGAKADSKRFGRYFGAEDKTAAHAADYSKDPKFNRAAAIREEFDFYAKLQKTKGIDGVLERGEQAKKSRRNGKPSV